MKKAAFLPILVVLVVAGCGGGSSASLKSNDVATVGGTHIEKPEYDALIAQAKRSFAQQNRPFPKVGTPDYETVKGQAVTLLVQQAEREDKAKSMGIDVSDSDVQKRLEQIKKQYFGGSEKKYQAQLKKQKLSDEQVRKDIRAQLVSEAVFNKVTKDVTVSNDDVHQYYVTHPQLYSQPQTRDVQYILVKQNKTLALSIYNQLKAGNAKTFCTLAKKYSQDQSSAGNCGKATFSKGQTVPEFDKVAFSAKQGLQPPFKSAQYGWFVVKTLGTVKPRSTTPEKQVSSSIKQQLLQQKKNQAMTDWVSDLSKSFCGDSKIKYQVGYKPSPDPCASTTTSATTTG
jgi:parvulin-like peptidyl-prolyl isomerase